MPNIRPLASLLVVAALAFSGPGRAQNIGGGTIDLQNGAAGSNQPSSYAGKRTVAPQAEAPSASEDAVPKPAPPSESKAKKQKKPAAPRIKGTKPSS